MEQTQPAEQVTPNPAVEAKPVETSTPPAQPAIPEKYELKLPEGSPLEPGYLESFSQYAKEKKLTQEMAQDVLNRESVALQSYQQRLDNEWKSTQEAWVNQIKADKEVGGDNFKESIAVANDALKKFATPEFVAEVIASGYGNHPELVRTFYKIGKMLANDKSVSPGAVSGGQKSLEEVFYGKQQ